MDYVKPPSRIHVLVFWHLILSFLMRRLAGFDGVAGIDGGNGFGILAANHSKGIGFGLALNGLLFPGDFLHAQT